MFGKYKIISALGSGSFGTVYLSKHLQLECLRAIKVFPKPSSARDILHSEAQLLKSLKHPCIPTLYDIEEDEDYYYLIEEYVSGESLEEFLLHQSTISHDFLLNISEQLCGIFFYLHTRSPSPVLYLDLKPEHIIVCGMKVKLIDFNVSTYLSNLGNIYNLFGNKEYSAPELFQGEKPTILCDIYSIGKIMLFLSQYADMPLSPNIYHIMKKAAHTDPAFRFETVEKLLCAIESARQMQPSVPTRRTIAVVGSHNGCGTTHIAISLVSALNYMGYRSVYIEKNASNHLSALLLSRTPTQEKEGQIIRRFFQGYPQYGSGITIDMPSNVITVYDYGCFLPPDAAVDDIIYVCSNSPWHEIDAIEKGESLLLSHGSLKVICNTGTKDTLRFLARHLKVPVFAYPFYPDAFIVNSSLVQLTSSLLHLKGGKHLFFHLKKLFFKRKP